ncbi:hypothetical protein [Isobaculum melis]|uniref:Type VII secretion effector, SACOL2603 family n=1 Tax=Isobaculum melis TaxID=142588 RepID=A0A1H9UK47_9LACT|nr:hypothetical protein [Isobaculum melis]SES09507.1 hypothetical protein SAMN04488559_13314 [Isobaculum melis]
MADKKLDVNQIKNTNFSSHMSNILNGPVEAPSSGLLSSIAAGDNSKDAIQNCTTTITKCSDSLAKAVTQMNNYMNNMVQAFEDMDKELAEKLDVTISGASTTSGPPKRKRANKYSGKLTSSK